MQLSTLACSGINELYPAVQGEGFLLGEPSIFLRTQGCSFGCVACDTKYSWPSAKLTRSQLPSIAQTLRDMAKTAHCTGLVITGGEPFEQPPEMLAHLLKLVRSDFRHITIETAAFVPIEKIGESAFAEIVNVIDVMSVSPKLAIFWRGGDRKMDNYLQTPLAYLRTASEYCQPSCKIVITNPSEELPKVVRLLTHEWASVIDDIFLCFQPNGFHEDGRPLSLSELADKMRELNDATTQEYMRPLYEREVDFRILPQLHRMIYGTARLV